MVVTGHFGITILTEGDMQMPSLDAIWRQWIGAESTGKRRAVAAIPLLLIGLVLWLTVLNWIIGENSVLVMAGILVGLGIFARHWLVVVTMFLAAALFGWVLEISNFLWIGGDEWARRNAEHWQGNEPATEKLLGQLIEYVVFSALFLVPCVALGVLIGLGIDYLRWNWSDRHVSGV
jgi:hypothetical protein